MTSTEMKKFLSTWFGEVCYGCSLTVLPGSAWVVLIDVLQRNFFTSVCDVIDTNKVLLVTNVKLLFIIRRAADLEFSPSFIISSLALLETAGAEETKLDKS